MSAGALPWLVGLGLAAATLLASRLAGFDRDRVFYPFMLIVVASYYMLFAALGGSGTALTLEVMVLIAFFGLAVAGFRSSLWIVAAGLLAHGILDAFHPVLITDSGAPASWPPFCLAFDVFASGWMAVSLLRRSPSPGTA